LNKGLVSFLLNIIQNYIMQKKKIASHKIILSLLVFLSALTSGAKEQLRIMTFNVPKGNIPAVGLNTWPNRALALQAFLNEAQPDLLGMQEPPVSELTDLLVGMPGYTLLGVARDDGKQQGEYSPIIYRTGRFTVERSGTYWLSLTPDVVSKNWESACNRIATWAIFRDKVTKARFLYTNTHLDHISNDARYHQMRVIKEHVKQLFEEEGEMPAFITGDFNSNKMDATSPVKVAADYLVPMNDAYKIARHKKGVTYTFPASKVKIDYIMVTKDVSVETAYIHNSIYESGQQISDHNAHYADIAWNTTNEEKRDSLLAVAQACYDSLLVFNATDEKLITDASDNGQITSDGAEKGCTYKMLTDLNTTTVFFSRYNSPQSAGRLHYLQADLKRNDITAFRLRLERSRISSNTKLAPTYIRIEASDNGTEWHYIADLNDMNYGSSHAYWSPVVTMPRAYRYLRFSIMRTGNMDIVVSGPRFAVAEFQLYPANLDKDKSQRYYDAGLNEAANTLLEKMEAARKTGSEESCNQLLAAIQAVRSLYIPIHAYNALLEKAKNMLNTFSVGTQLGQCTQEAADDLAEGIRQLETATAPTADKTEIENAMASLQTLMENFEDRLVYFEEDKWFYLVNHARIMSGTTRNRVLHSASADSRLPLLNAVKDSAGVRLAQGTNPHAMWRFIKTDEGRHTYALQNRATGFYLGLTDDDNSRFISSTNPVSFTPLFTAPGEFSLGPSGSDRYLTASTDGFLYNRKDATAASNASWTVQEVAADLEAIEMKVAPNSISIVCFPFPVDNLSRLNPGMQGYAANSAPGLLPTLYFQKKESFAAGEPFVLVTGDPNKFDESAGKTLTLKLTPPEQFTDKPLAANGLVGVLDKSRVPSGYFFEKSVLRNRTRTSTIEGQSGYIVRSQIEPTGQPIDLTVHLNAGVEITAIADITAGKTNKNAACHDLNGRKLPRPQKGINIIDRKKVKVK